MKTQLEPHQRQKRHIARMDKNLHFLTMLDRKSQYQPPKNINLREHLRKINAKVKALDADEQLEWAECIMLKCLGLQRARKEKEMILALRILIEVCNQNDIRYEGERAEGMLKEIYYQKYGKNILQVFREAGYSTSEFQILEYQDSWLTKILNFFSIW